MAWLRSSGWKLWGQGSRPQPWLLLAGVAGALLVVIGSWLGREKPATPPPPLRPDKEVISPLPSDGIARQLEEVLSLVAGAGEVRVSVTYRAGPRQQVAQNTSETARRTEEKEPDGSLRVTTEEQKTVQAVMARPQAGEEPVVLQEESPEIAGVLVVASGAQDPLVRRRLSQAAQTLLGLPAHRVQVVPSR